MSDDRERIIKAVNAYRVKQLSEPTAADIADYQQTIRNLRETIAHLKSEMHEVSYAIEYGDVTQWEAAKRLRDALNGEVQSER